MENEFRDLEIWKKSMDFVEDVYRFTKKLPDDERYGLIVQMRRASVSIPSNIAEGKMRSTGKDFRSFLFRALASAAELQIQVEICERLRYGEPLEATGLRTKIRPLMLMIRGLNSRLNR